MLWAYAVTADSAALQLERGLLAHAPTRVDASAYVREAGEAAERSEFRSQALACG
jgi:hypothetical protein